MLVSWASQTLTVVSPIFIDDRGKKVATFPPDAPRREVPGCDVQPGGSSEDLALRQNLIIRFTALLPAGAIVSESDQIIYQNRPFAIDGAIEDWFSPTGAISYRKLVLIDWKG